ncbi:MAG: Pseudouridine synthase [Hydrocarboniphaga sp.]|nr:23S rRNA pseudouridine(1911/1915/1917) synthase RluD [Hydrocarboniphaga sp.]MDB5972911.1 Pseudouridine synthase [Hydrocarboniphaga sp.]
MNAEAPDESEDLESGGTVPSTVEMVEVVPAELAGQRLDAVAAKLFPDHSRSRLKTWIDEGSLWVNGAPAVRGRDPVKQGDRLDLRAEVPEVNYDILPQNLPLEVVYADESLAIIRKPAGLTVHPGAGQRDNTLQNALLYHFPQTALVPRAGIVHRLDKDTSGLLVVALTVTAHTYLADLIARRDVSREYDALITGTIVAGSTIDLPIGRHPRDRLRMAVSTGGRKAVTHYRVQERFKHHTLLRVKLETGRTHQIRVHLSHLKWPIVGDQLYGGRVARGVGMSLKLREALLAFPRQALHARALELEHPVTGELLSFANEPPEDFQALLQLLRDEQKAG